MKANVAQKRIAAFDPILRSGRVRKILATHIEADGPNVPLGALCAIETGIGEGAGSFQAEVVGVDHDHIVLVPLEEGLPTHSGALVRANAHLENIPVGDAFLGRAVDALARPFDNLGPVRASAFASLHSRAMSPLSRRSPVQVVETGLRSIDGLLTVGQGQRVGIFAPSGAGKTSLMTQIARQVAADVVVLCLVGERGREVEALWQRSFTVEDRARAALVAATSDQSAAMRVRACSYALSLAEYWRDQGKHVLFLLDSVTRLAMALREIGLAAGEPPTIRAYTPSVFGALPKIVERCGAVDKGGAITAVMTVLSETEEIDDPISEIMKSLLDGHLILSRELAEQGRFPAIDVKRSVSRQADGLVSPKQAQQAQRVREWLSTYETSKTLIDTGLYTAGTNLDIDRAVERHPHIVRFLKQPAHQRSTFVTTQEALSQLAEGKS